MQNSLRLASYYPIDDKSALIQVMVWHLTGNKPLPDPMLTQFSNSVPANSFQKIHGSIHKHFLSLIKVYGYTFRIL